MPDGPRPSISIVIPTFLSTAAQADLLDETLRSVDAQSVDDYEVIVVDDGSAVDVARVAAGHKGTRMFRQTNAGSAVARNTGIAASRGSFILFLDGDDLLLPGALEAHLRAFSDHPDCGYTVGPREEMTFEGTPVPWTVQGPPAERHLYDILLGFDWYIIPPSSAMFRRAVVESVGGFRDPWGADDLDFYLRVARDHAAACFQEPAVTRYRRYSTSSSRDGERMLRSIRTVYERQRQFVSGRPTAQAAYDRGLQRLTDIFVDCLVENVADRVRAGQWGRAWRSATQLLRERPRRLPAAIYDAARAR